MAPCGPVAPENLLAAFHTLTGSVPYLFGSIPYPFLMKINRVRNSASKNWQRSVPWKCSVPFQGYETLPSRDRAFDPKCLQRKWSDILPLDILCFSHLLTRWSDPWTLGVETWSDLATIVQSISPDRRPSPTKNSKVFSQVIFRRPGGRWHQERHRLSALEAVTLCTVDNFLTVSTQSLL